MKAKLKCRNCGSENTEVMAEMIVSFPSEYYHHVTKRIIQNKSFKIWGVDWINASIICKDCGYTLDHDTEEHDKKIKKDTFN